MATWVGCTAWWQHAHPLLASTRDCSHYSRSLAGMALDKFYATTTPLSPVNRNARAAVLCGRPCCCIRETVWHILCAPRSAHTHLYIVHHAAKILILISFSGLFSSPLSGSLSPTSPKNKKPLQANLPFEYTSLMTFSSRCKTEVEFGNNNHQELREALRQIHLGDRTAWSAALKAVSLV